LRVTDTSDQDPQSSWGAPRRKTVEWYDPLATAEAGRTLSGLDFLRAIRDGKLAPPPIASLMGFRIVEVETGLVVFECEHDESVYNPIGVVHGGLVCTLVDSAVGCAVQTTLAAGVAYTSIDLNVSYLRPVTSGSGVLRATGRVTKPGRRVAYALGEVVDGAGKLVATATTSCLVMGSS
jgi:uncharacterized protein (TIGR00369 family)